MENVIGINYYVDRAKQSIKGTRLDHLLKDLLNKYETLCMTHPGWRTTDARLLVFNKCFHSIYCYGLALCFSGGILIETNNLKSIVGPIFKCNTDYQQQLKFFEQSITFGFFHQFFSANESFFRNIVAITKVYAGEKTLKGDESLRTICKSLISKYALNEQYKSLIELLIEIRNCVHNWTIYVSPSGDQKITYKGVTYHFTHGVNLSFTKIEKIVDFFYDLI